ncbi:PIN domain-containing protein family protein [Candidatus Protofrankia californiensis]|uniref:Ribonuclease VapC n=1 Tax=Candidatus Protofrankia californiensis TaxID=1839754 RepID=A0A1C3NWW9_9ACTN|nr:PIN domain-containing protein family protein [Candidatus Protofrankia californiensis]
MTTLLDANVLIALIVSDHVHHDAAEAWLSSTAGSFATCPITEGSLVRLLMREGQSAQTATAVVSALTSDPRHEFWPDEISYDAVSMKGVIGHRQVTDAYLAQLARIHDGRLASFDQGLAKLHYDVVDLIPTS